jgi:hypothetical protein
MRKHLVFGVFAIVSLGAVALPTAGVGRLSASPSAASSGVQVNRSVTVDRTRDRGDFVSLSFNRSNPVTCADGSAATRITDVSLFARNNVTRTDGSTVAIHQINIAINFQDSCDFVTTSIVGTLTDPPGYQQDGTKSATISGTVAMTDAQTGASAGTVTVSLSFVGGVNPIRFVNYNKFITPTVRITARSAGDFSEATVTGTFDYNGTNLLPGADDVSSSLGVNTSGSRVITKMQ